jgi:ABC-2 type transport system ATP-binding protein
MLRAEAARFAYGRWHRADVFDDFSWQVEPGQTTLLLGPNGAGKSTLLKLLCGFERPNGGRISYDGESGRRVLYTNVGWMPQRVDAARGLTALEQVEYAAWVAGASRKAARELADSALSDVDLPDKAGVPASHLSGGQLRRLGLAQALVRRAPVLLLDEPTSGLDPAQTINFRRLLSRLKCPGGIVISTHQVSDLAADVDRVAVLAKGRIAFDGTVEAFKQHGSMSGAANDSLAEIFASMIGGGLH